MDEIQETNDLQDIQPIDPDALFHFEQQFRNSLASLVLGVVEESGVTRGELALRLDWPITRVNRLLHQALEWDIDDAAVLAYAADGVLIELGTEAA